MIWIMAHLVSILSYLTTLTRRPSYLRNKIRAKMLDFSRLRNISTTTGAEGVKKFLYVRTPSPVDLDSQISSWVSLTHHSWVSV